MAPFIRPLTATAFAPFGEVIEANDPAHSFIINQGFTERFHDLAKVDVNAEGGRVGVSIFRSQPLPFPISLCLLERHPLASQAFMPLSHRPYLVAVAPPGDLDETQIRIFLAAPGQGVNYRAGTWHHFCLALEQPSDFLVIDRIGSGENCHEHLLQQAIYIEAKDLLSVQDPCHQDQHS
jgi:ureidoglycolate lyase